MTTIYLTRHGETEWNLARRLQGQLDSPLTDKGKLQAEWLRDRLEDIEFSAIYSSSSNRALDTAHIVKGQRQMTVETRKELMEIMMGSWEGQKVQVIEKEDPTNFFNFWNKPELFETTIGETFDDVIERSYQVLEDIKANHTGNVLVVSHGIVLKSLLCAIARKPLSELWDGPFMKQTSLTILEATNDGFDIILSGDISHHRGFE